MNLPTCKSTYHSYKLLTSIMYKNFCWRENESSKVAYHYNMTECPNTWQLLNQMFKSTEKLDTHKRTGRLHQNGDGNGKLGVCVYMATAHWGRAR